MLKYVKVRFDAAGECYQEIDGGHCVRYVDENGNALFSSVDKYGNTVFETPLGGCEIVDVAPTVAPEMRANALANRLGMYNVDAKGDRRVNPRRRQADRDTDNAVAQGEIYKQSSDRLVQSSQQMYTENRRLIAERDALLAEVERLTAELAQGR